VHLAGYFSWVPFVQPSGDVLVALDAGRTDALDPHQASRF